MKKITLLFLFSQIVIVILSFFSTLGFSLLSYINYSFYIGGLLLFIGGVFYIFRTGSFDFFTKSMRKVVSTKNNREALETMRSPSEVFSMSPKVFLLTGLPIFVSMLVALAVYYS